MPRDNPLYTDTQRALFKYVPGLAQGYRLRLGYLWESEAYKLKGGEGPAKVRSQVEAYFLAHMKATAPKKYHEQLTPHYPVRQSAPPFSRLFSFLPVVVLLANPTTF